MTLIELPRSKRRPQTRKPHIISKFYLEKFCDESGYIEVYESGKGSRRGLPKNECVERDYFDDSLVSPTGNLETWFARTEAQAGEIYPRICERQPLSIGERVTWSVFLAQLLLRTRKIRDQLGKRVLTDMKSDFGPDYITNLQYDLFKQGRLIPLEEIRQAMQRTLDYMGENPSFGHLAGIEQSIQTTSTNIIERNWYIIDNIEDIELISSDSPVITMRMLGNGSVALGCGMGLRDVAIMFPLNPGKLFVASPSPFAWPDMIDAQQVSQINVALIQFADRNVYGRRKTPAIEKLVNEEIGKVIYGANAFA
jgi:hypothetical protein